MDPIHEAECEAAAVQLYWCEYDAPCRARGCAERRATTIARKVDHGGRFLRQIELCNAHAAVVVARERAAGLEIVDRR